MDKEKDKVLKRIKGIKKKLGKSLVILGHHYQCDEVIQFADFRGDSLDLSRRASQENEARRIVFCGVHFMAECADILSKPSQQVFLPDSGAGCPMADMADIFQVKNAWNELVKIVRLPADGIIPITYINSSAEIKGFCGKNKGIVCTSSNAEKIFDWAMDQNKKIFFFPDQHLGANTALKKGIGEKEMVIWDPGKRLGGSTAARIKRAKVILWKGFCHVHTFFSPDHVKKIRCQYPDIKIIVHPECEKEVVKLADLAGSTGFIVKTIKEAPSGSKWAVGTEINLVGRLARVCPDKLVIPLARSLCPNMSKINVYNLCQTLEAVLAKKCVNRIKVEKAVAKWARVALDRMLSIS